MQRRYMNLIRITGTKIKFFPVWLNYTTLIFLSEQSFFYIIEFIVKVEKAIQIICDTFWVGGREIATVYFC